MNNFFTFIYKRLRFIIVTFLIIFQILFFFGFAWILSNNFVNIYVVNSLIIIVSTFLIINNDIKSEFKLSWIFVVSILPIFGMIFYLVFATDIFNKKLKNDMCANKADTKKFMLFNEEIERNLKSIDKIVYKQSTYLKEYAGSPLYKNNKTSYVSPGEDIYRVLLENIKSAKKFIFLEYFIIDEGEVWKSILKELVKKVKQGVDVRIIYDDAGCIKKLPFKYYIHLNELGIRCKVFNPLRPSMSIVLNFRNHRKMAVIDGNTVITGGMNLADEYINKDKDKLYWKDSCVVLKGSSVWSFTLNFLQFWNFESVEDIDYDIFRPEEDFVKQIENDKEKSCGFVQPFFDNPMDKEPVSQYVFLNMILNASEYIYIYTPYFIVDSELLDAICLSSKNGVHVKMVLPSIPDKKFVNIITKSYYKQLIEAGVEILEYMPGFIHSKCILCDDKLSVVGTINFDYRSLFHHFECGVFLYDTVSNLHLKKDFLSTFEKCKVITFDDVKKQKLHIKIMQFVSKIFATLM